MRAHFAPHRPVWRWTHSLRTAPPCLPARPALADDAPAFTPKRPLLRDLSKPSYRSEDLHRVLSPLLSNLGSRGGLGRPASGGSKADSHAAHAAVPMREPASAAGQRGSSPAAGSRPASAQALRRSVSAPASPALVQAAGAAHGKGSSMPSSPLLGTRLTKAAAARAAASQVSLAGPLRRGWCVAVQEFPGHLTCRHGRGSCSSLG